MWLLPNEGEDGWGRWFCERGSVDSATNSHWGPTTVFVSDCPSDATFLNHGGVKTWGLVMSVWLIHHLAKTLPPFPRKCKQVAATAEILGWADSERVMWRFANSVVRMYLESWRQVQRNHWATEPNHSVAHTRWRKTQISHKLKWKTVKDPAEGSALTGRVLRALACHGICSKACWGAKGRSSGPLVYSRLALAPRDRWQLESHKGQQLVLKLSHFSKQWLTLANFLFLNQCLGNIGMAGTAPESAADAAQLISRADITACSNCPTLLFHMAIKLCSLGEQP